MGSWYLAYVGFRNLKSYVPFVRPHMMDADLAQLDRKLAFGHDPATLLHHLLGTGVAAHLMSITYVAWIVFLTLSLLIALFWTSNLDTACWYVTAVAVNWVLGVSIYYLVPSTGPIYARPELFADLPDTQAAHIAQGWLIDRIDMLADPFGTDALQTIAAFASLHVSVMVTASLISKMIRLRPVFIQWGLWFFLFLNVLAVVYLGWHYLVDVFGGVAIGVAAVWIAAWGTGNQHRLPSLLPSRHEYANVLTAVPVRVRRERRHCWLCASRTREVLDVADRRDPGADRRLAHPGRAWPFEVTPWACCSPAWHLLGRRHPRRLAGAAPGSGDQDRGGGGHPLRPAVGGPVLRGAGLAGQHPGRAGGVYVAEFLVVDLLLSLAFRAWPLVSPNYFYLVDHRIWALNWSPLGKTINSAAFLAHPPSHRERRARHLLRPRPADAEVRLHGQIATPRAARRVSSRPSGPRRHSTAGAYGVSVSVPELRPGEGKVLPRQGEGCWWVAPMWTLVALFAVVTAFGSHHFGVPVRDPHGAWFLRRVTLSLVLFVLLTLVDAGVRASRRGWTFRSALEVLRGRWTRGRLALAMTGLLAYHVVYLCYHNLKSWNVFNEPRDDMLHRWDRVAVPRAQPRRAAA